VSPELPYWLIKSIGRTEIWSVISCVDVGVGLGLGVGLGVHVGFLVLTP
jgi:hypothetical protein